MRKDEELSARLLDFAAEVISLVQAFPKGPVGLHIGNQLLRSSTSSGANYEEACGAESHRDFTHKMGIVLKELKESRYWLQLARRISLVNPASPVDLLLTEVEQLIAIFGKSISTARKRMANEKWKMTNE